jgi:hypothetical protein
LTLAGKRFSPQGRSAGKQQTPHSGEEKMLLDTQRAKKETVSVSPKMIGQGQGFERTRRITGYLVGTLDRFNNAKRAEERDRVKHGAGSAR